jgi:predicted TIM-barrel fold metal-dependent hydrolase
MDGHDIKSYRAFLDGLKVPFIIDHMGRPEAKLGVKQDAFLQMLDLMKNPLAWTKVSGPERISSTGKPFHDAEPFVRELIAAAPDRLLWGTDFPHPNVKLMPNDGELVDLFAKFCDDETMRRKILVENPNRLYWPELS